MRWQLNRIGRGVATSRSPSVHDHAHGVTEADDTGDLNDALDSENASYILTTAINYHARAGMGKTQKR